MSQIIHFCQRTKWKVIPFLVFFFVTIAVLLGVYRFRALQPNDAHDAAHLVTKGGLKRGRFNKHALEEAATYDRWLVISDDQHIDYLCSLIDISAELGWRSLIAGNNVTCCRKSCILLDDNKIKKMNYDILSYIPSYDSLMKRNVAYLYAIQHGARHIFDAYPDIYVSALVDIDTFRYEMYRQLHNLTLDVALGLVSEKLYVKRVQNPYAHFGRPDLWTEGFRRNNQRNVHNHVYRICEVRPPSLEKYLDTDDGFFDLAAPSLTLPGATVAPFSSKNTLYSIEAFWGLALLPTVENQIIPSHLLRTLWNQAVLGDIAGSMKLSLSSVSTFHRREKSRKDPSELREPDGLATFLLKWTCSTRSSLGCIRDLSQNMFQFHYISAREAAFFESWIVDLQKLRYLEPPIIPRRRGYMNPCLGADGLYGVAFYPSLQPKLVSEDKTRVRNSLLERYLEEEKLLDHVNRARYDPIHRTDAEGSSNPIMFPHERMPVLQKTEEKNNQSEEIIPDLDFSHRHGKLYDGVDHVHEDMPLVREFTDSMCPGYGSLLPHRSDYLLKNVLLIVAMTTHRYDMIPMFEAIYRHQFKNILYCGAPHDSIEIFLRKYQLSEDRSFSFLPAHTKYTYECLLGALEMGYHVDGYIMSTDDALINTWNIPAMNFSKLWYGGDNIIQITSRDWKTLDPGGQKLPRSLEGVLKVLEFLKSALIGSTDDRSPHFDSRLHHSKLFKREAEMTEGTEEDVPSLSRQESREPSLESKDVLHTDEDPSAQRSLKQVVSVGTDHSVASHDQVVLDLVELKSISTLPETEELPLLKYDINTTNETVPQLNTHEDSVVVDKESENHRDVQMNSSDTEQTQLNLQPVFESFQNRSSESDLQTINSNNSEELIVEEGSPNIVTEEIVSEEEDNVEDEEEDLESERPVAEVLRKLLVATRNTSQETTSSETTSTEAVTSLDTNSSSISTTEIPVEEVSVNPDHIFHFEDEWDKPNVTRNNPTLDLFLHPNPVPETSHHEIIPSTDINKDNETIEHVEEMSSPHLVQVDEAKVEIDLIAHDEMTGVVDVYHVVPPQNTTKDLLEIPIAAQLPEPNVSIVVDQKSDKRDDKINSTSHVEEERKTADDHVHETLTVLQDIYRLIKENLGFPADPATLNVDEAIYGGDRSRYRLNPKTIHQFRCEKGTSLEFCKVSSEFLYQLSENSGKDLNLVYDKVPLYYIPTKHQLKFYLLSNLMLQHGVTDEIAIPLILMGLSPEQEWSKIERSYFGGYKMTGEIPSKYPLFHPGAALLYPADLNTIITDSKIQKVFCLKYLLRILQT